MLFIYLIIAKYLFTDSAFSKTGKQLKKIFLCVNYIYLIDVAIFHINYLRSICMAMYRKINRNSFV